MMATMMAKSAHGVLSSVIGLSLVIMLAGCAGRKLTTSVSDQTLVPGPAKAEAPKPEPAPAPVPIAPRVAEEKPVEPMPPMEKEQEKVTRQQAEGQTFGRPVPEAPPVAEAPPPPPAPVPEAPPVQPPEKVTAQQAEAETFGRPVPEAPPVAEAPPPAPPIAAAPPPAEPMPEAPPPAPVPEAAPPPVVEAVPPEVPPPAPTPPVEEAPRPPAPAPAPAAPLVLADAFFDYDRFTLRKDAIAALEENARLLKAHNSTTLLIEGHADERGTLEYNLVLGERRARAVKQYLEDLGVPASSMKIISYGKERPFCTVHSDACWQQNRRARLVIQ